MTPQEASDAIDDIDEMILALEIKAGLHSESAPQAGFLRNIYFSVEDLGLRKSLIGAKRKCQALWIALQEAKLAEAEPDEVYMERRLLDFEKSAPPVFTEKEEATGMPDPDRPDSFAPLE